MADSMIACPKCGEKIALTSAIEGPIAERLKAELEGKLAAERAKLVAQAKANAEAQLAGQLGELRAQLGEKAKLLETAQATELELRKQRREFFRVPLTLPAVLTPVVDGVRAPERV